jgi:hypothetical protein
MRDMTTKVLLVIVAFGNALVGVWAAVAPRSFYADFPGGGRHWVSIDGPFNEHLVRDVGTLNLALAAIAVAALVRPVRYLVLVLAAAELVNSLPHFLYHATHVDAFATGDKVALLVSLGVAVVAPLALVVRASHAPDPQGAAVAGR